LPTLDELIGSDGTDERNVAAAILALTGSGQDQVFTLHAELEGGLLAPAFDALLRGWRAQGHELVSLGALHRHVERDALAALAPRWGSVPGRSGELIVAP
ncbi:MAG TPA: 4-deoxy-4-formamido-L-arabinose-phosphoundecaprenol deformylase, partial [Caldimonas sp.]